MHDISEVVVAVWVRLMLGGQRRIIVFVFVGGFRRLNRPIGREFGSRVFVRLVVG